MGSDQSSAPDPAGSARSVVFARSEVALAHAVYGLILTLATLGELLHYEIAADASVAWLLGAGAVLVLAHLFSDVLAHVAATREEPDWPELTSIGREDLTVGAGAVAAAGIMAVAAIADLDTQRALSLCVVLGLVAVAALTFFATPQHRASTRVLLSVVAVVLGAGIVTLENLF